MPLAMPRPWKHPSTGAYYLYQRVPTDLARTAKGQTIKLPVNGEDRSIKIGTHVKVSLATKEPSTAKDRFREADDTLALHWQRLRSAPVALSHRQVLAMAGRIAKDIRDRFDEEPGPPAMWEELLRLNVRLGAAGDGTEGDYAAALDRWYGSTVDDAFAAASLQVAEGSRLDVLRRVHVAFMEVGRETLAKALGDYGQPSALSRYPEWKQPTEPEAPSRTTRHTISGLFDDWRKSRADEGGSPSSAKRWEGPISSLRQFVGHDDAEAVTGRDILGWRDAVLETGTTSRKTFRRVHLAAVKAIYNWGISELRLTTNPTQGLKVTEPKSSRERPKGFTTDEAAAILRAANAAPTAPGDTGATMRRAYRWLPWLQAYTGARIGELAQLRKQDVMTVGGIPCIRITPEAGTVKNKQFRDVPLHPHLVEMGFPEMVASLPKGPVFYALPSRSSTPWALTTGRLAGWVRSTAGVTDKRVSPTHGWRHLFKTIGRSADIGEFYLDGICGHARSHEGAEYGDTPLQAILREIEKFPRFDVRAGRD